MTAISPLEFVHKKGLFGNHHKKKESNLIQISELKNLSIVQVVEYKKSNVKSNSIKIDNLEMPLQNSKTTSNQDTRILLLGPRTWLVISKKENIINTIKEKCDEKNFATTDISHSRAVIQIKGYKTKDVLKKGCPINLNDFEKNNCAGTIFHGISVVIDFVDSNPDTFNLLTLRSFGESFYHHITDATLEFGYIIK